MCRSDSFFIARGSEIFRDMFSHGTSAFTTNLFFEKGALIGVCPPVLQKHAVRPFLYRWWGSCGQQIQANIQGPMKQNASPGHNLRLRDEGGGRGRSSTHNKKTQDSQHMLNQPGALSSVRAKRGRTKRGRSRDSGIPGLEPYKKRKKTGKLEFRIWTPESWKRRKKQKKRKNRNSRSGPFKTGKGGKHGKDGKSSCAQNPRKREENELRNEVRKFLAATETNSGTRYGIAGMKVRKLLKTENGT